MILLSGCSHQQVLEGEFSEPARQEAADPANDCSAVRTQDEQAVGESFSDVATDKDSDADGAGNVAVHTDPAHWDSLSQCSEEQLRKIQTQSVAMKRRWMQSGSCCF